MKTGLAGHDGGRISDIYGRYAWQWERSYIKGAGDRPYHAEIPLAINSAAFLLKAAGFSNLPPSLIMARS